MTDADLFHVTTKWKAKQILRNGMKSGMPTSEEEGYLRAYMEEHDIDYVTPEVIDEYHEDKYMGDVQQSAEKLAREKLNELLPNHYGSLFFWTNEEEAKDMENIMERKNGKDYVVIGVNSDELKKDAYVADFELSDEIFSELEELYSKSYSYEEEEKIMDRVYDMVKDYQDSVEVYDEHEDESLEVLYPDDIPLDAIVSIDGQEINLTQSQKRLDEYKSRGRGWWEQPVRHAMASRGLKTRRKR